MPADNTAHAHVAVSIKSVPAARVVALREVIANYQSQGPLWARVFRFMETHNTSRDENGNSACFAVFYDSGFKASNVDTEVCMPIDRDVVVPDDDENVRVAELPELPRAACMTHNGPYDGMTAAYEQLFAWIGTNGETVNGPVREIYHVCMETHGGDANSLVTEIVVPLA